MTIPTWFVESICNMQIRCYTDLITVLNIGEINMWTKPEVTEMRFGFEVTMYVCNR